MARCSRCQQFMTPGLNTCARCRKLVAEQILGCDDWGTKIEPRRGWWRTLFRGGS